MHQQGVKHLRIVEDCRKSLVAERLKSGIVRSKDRIRPALREHRLRKSGLLDSLRKYGQVLVLTDQLGQRHARRLFPGGHVLVRGDRHPLGDDDDDTLHRRPLRRGVDHATVGVSPRIGEGIVEGLVLLYRP
ncbi:hypothetical protein DSECCO2_581060 [anaerobic digester metagenome]